ncbi:MAG: TIGR03560 family F420-dependent LLM class oxidoreductase [Candidatus Dormibacteraceae bacterium]
MTHPVRLGIKMAPHNCTLDQLRGVWRLADEAGFDHLWDFDHLAPIRSDLSGPAFEGWILLAAMAASTRNVRLGVMVTANPLRHPSLLAKMAATVDHLSGGRLEFGIGAGWAEEEFKMLGLDLPRVGERIDRLDEACEVVKRLWTGSAADYEGRYYHLARAHSVPAPLQRPHPPIWIGGTGERRTLRVVARHADVWNVLGHSLASVAEAARLSAVLDAHCADVGRDPGTIRRSVQLPIDGERPEATVAEFQDYVAAGFTELVVGVGGPAAVAAAETAARVILPALREPR